MINLGKKIDNPEMYPSMNGEDKQNKEPKVIYKTVIVPLAIVGDTEPEIGDEITITIKGIVKSIIKDEYCEDLCIEAIEGKTNSIQADEEDDTLLG